MTPSSSSTGNSTNMTPATNRTMPQHYHHPGATSSSASSSMMRQTPSPSTGTTSTAEAVHILKTPSSASSSQHSRSSSHHRRRPPIQQQQRQAPQPTIYSFGSPFASPRPHSAASSSSSSSKRRPRRPTPQPLILDPSSSSNNNGNSQRSSRSSTTRGGVTTSSPQIMTPFATTGSTAVAISPSPARHSQHPPATAAYASSPYVLCQPLLPPQQPYSLHGHPHYSGGGGGAITALPTALDLSRTASKAGYLQKLGMNIPEYKRRFFVLPEPTTRIYYYLSPHDVHARGWIDLDASASLQPIENLPDGRFRFAITWDEGGGEIKNNINNDDQEERVPQQQQQQKQQRQSIILEARSQEIGEQWIDSIEGIRVSKLQHTIETLTEQSRIDQSQIQNFKHEIDNYKMVEQDRDGAIEDAQKWKTHFEQLDEAIRLLTQQLRRPPPSSSSAEATTGTTTTRTPASTSTGNATTTNGKGGALPQQHEEKDADQEIKDKYDRNHNDDDNDNNGVPGEEKKDATMDEVNERTNTPTPHHEQEPQTQQERNSSLLDVTLDEDQHRGAEDQDIGDWREVPGTYFAALSNACQQQRQSLRLASEEATKAVEDLQASQSQLAVLERRMQKAEKHLCTLWEENCTLRKTLKQKKRDKRVLVREVKALQHQVAVDQQEQEAAQQREQEHREKLELQQQQQRATRMEQRLQLQANLMKQQHQQQQHAGAVIPTFGLQPGQEHIEDDDEEEEEEEADTSMMGSEDERLLTELEEHVASTIRLHERFLAASGEALVPSPPSLPQPPKQQQEEEDQDNDVLNTSLEGSYGAPSEDENEEDDPLETSMEDSAMVATATDATRQTRPRGGATLRIQQQQQQNAAPSGRLSPLQPKLLSLFDDDDDEASQEAEEMTTRILTEAEEDEDEDDYSHAMEQPSVATTSQLSAICSVSVEVGDSATDDGEVDSYFSGSRQGHHRRRPSSSEDASTRHDRNRKNPLLILDDDDGEDNSHDDDRKNIMELQPNIATNGQATSRLVCPMADVIPSTPAIATTSSHTADVNKHNVVSLSAARKPPQLSAESNEDLRVYHVTFYTQKIGIQFQKAPPPPTRSKGLLTDAMTADLAGTPRDDGKTASELRGVAAISEWAKSGSGGTSRHKDDPTNKKKKTPSQSEMFCPVATPTDVVLVCGFEGFEDASSGSTVRPKLGARLVAFDGISVELGNWTFHSIRKSIKARGRPLTLSFRNDFLTTEQRTILTKAVADVAKAAPAPALLPPQPPAPPRHVIQYAQNHARRPSATPSLNSAVSTESDYFINDRRGGGSVDGGDYPMGPLSQQQEEDDEDELSRFSWQSRRGNLSSNNSVSTRQGGSSSRSRSYHPGGGDGFYSFSEAGTSSVISSAFAPLMANLLNGISDRTSTKEKFTPEYLQRQDSSLEDTPQHRDFQSNLL